MNNSYLQQHNDVNVHEGKENEEFFRLQVHIKELIARCDRVVNLLRSRAVDELDRHNIKKLIKLMMCPVVTVFTSYSDINEAITEEICDDAQNIVKLTMLLCDNGNENISEQIIRAMVSLRQKVHRIFINSTIHSTTLDTAKSGVVDDVWMSQRNNSTSGGCSDYGNRKAFQRIKNMNRERFSHFCSFYLMPDVEHDYVESIVESSDNLIVNHGSGNSDGSGDDFASDSSGDEKSRAATIRRSLRLSSLHLQKHISKDSDFERRTLNYLDAENCCSSHEELSSPSSNEGLLEDEYHGRSTPLKRRRPFGRRMKKVPSTGSAVQTDANVTLLSDITPYVVSVDKDQGRAKELMIAPDAFLKFTIPDTIIKVKGMSRRGFQSRLSKASVECKYTLYCVSVKTNMSTYLSPSQKGTKKFLLHRRFSDFVALYDALAPLGELPKFPKRRYFDRFNKERVEARRKLLESILHAASVVPAMVISHALMEFCAHGRIENTEYEHDAGFVRSNSERAITFFTPDSYIVDSSRSVRTITSPAKLDTSKCFHDADRATFNFEPPVTFFTPLASDCTCFFTPDIWNTRDVDDMEPQYPILRRSSTDNVLTGGNDISTRLQKRIVRLASALLEVNSSENVTSSKSVNRRLTLQRISIKEDALTVLAVVSHEGHHRIVLGNLDRLLEELFMPRSGMEDPEYGRLFFLCSRHFVKPTDLLMRLFRYYNVTAPLDATVEQLNYVSKRKASIRSRVLSGLLYWMKIYWHVDFDDNDMRDRLDDFLVWARQKATCDSTSLEPELIEMEAFVKEKDHALEAVDLNLADEKNDVHKVDCRPITSIKLYRDIVSDNNVITSYSARTLAENLTYLEYDDFSRLRPEELLVHLWGDNSLCNFTSNLSRYCEKFNHISYWVSSLLCTEPILRHRIYLLERIVEVANECLALNNFNTAMAIWSGLNHAAVQRLKKTWLEQTPRIVTYVEMLEATLNPSNNYKNYRSIMVNMGRTSCIPFLGLHLKDLYFSNEIPKYVLPEQSKDTSAPLINVEKLWKMISIIDSLLGYQRFPDIASQRNEQLCAHFRKIPYLEESMLYTLSLQIEPRDTAKKVRNIERWATMDDEDILCEERSQKV